MRSSALVRVKTEIRRNPEICGNQQYLGRAKICIQAHQFLGYIENGAILKMARHVKFELCPIFALYFAYIRPITYIAYIRKAYSTMYTMPGPT